MTFWKKSMVLAAAASLCLMPTVPASGKTMSACVHKKTGEMRMKKKCAKGWKKITWNRTGPTGPQGPQGATGEAGPSYMVRDKNGAVVGKFMNIRYLDPPQLRLERDGAWWNYDMAKGQLQPTGTAVYTTVDCTGTAYSYVQPADLAYWLSFVGGSGRIVERRLVPTGAAKAFALSSTVIPVAGATSLYSVDTASGCGPLTSASAGEYLIVLAAVPTPPDAAGPLSVS